MIFWWHPFPKDRISSVWSYSNVWNMVRKINVLTSVLKTFFVQRGHSVKGTNLFPTEKKQTASLWPGLFQTAPIISIIADLSLFIHFRKLSACYPPKTVPKDLNIGETPRFGEFLGLRNLQPCHLVADSATSSFKTGTPWERHGELLPCAWRVMSVASRFWCNMAASTVVSCPFCWFVSLKSSSTP